MSDMSVLPVNDNNGFGGGLGAGLFGGILGGLIFGNGGWGNRNGTSTGSAYDAGLLTGLSNQITHANDAAVAGQMATLQSASNQNMFMGNLINSTGDAIVGAINGGAMATQQALGSINENVTTQGYESRSMAQQLAAQSQNQFCMLSHQVFEENCKNRELARQIQSENQAQALADAKAQIASLQAQINLSAQLAASQAAQNEYLVSALKTTSAGA